MTSSTPAALAKYRERHTIHVPRNARGLGITTLLCPHDGILVIERRGGWRHHPDEIKYLAAVERGEVGVNFGS